MKKTLSLFIFLAFGLVSLVVYGQGLGDVIDNLSTDINFGYSATKKISVKNITTQSVIIESPLIKDANNQNVTKYAVMYGEYSLDEILNNTGLLNQTVEKPVALTTATDPFTVDLDVQALNPVKKYYLFVIPKDDAGNLGEVSNEVWFTVADKTFGDAGSNGQTVETHAAAGADMSLANISHTINGSTITLKWIAVAGSDTIDLSVMTPGSSSFNKVATLNMDDESYAFTADKNGEYRFQFVPNNNGKQVNYTVVMGGIPAATATTNTGTAKSQVAVVPVTGPAENAFAIVAIAAVGYFMYRKLYRKAK